MNNRFTNNFKQLYWLNVSYNNILVIIKCINANFTRGNHL